MSSDDAWLALRALTPARIALGRVGVGLPTNAHLAFQLAHAQARDAVFARLDVEALRARLPSPTIAVRAMPRDRAEYLARPDLGRRVDPADVALLVNHAVRPLGAIVVADGLSALAVERHASPLVERLVTQLTADGWAIPPIVVATQARVAIGDEIGERLGATAVVVLIGERPGLSAPDSLGAYFTYAPRVPRTDAERNCVSNIHAGGLSTDVAARTLRWLFAESLRRRLSGIALKNDALVLSG
jgi:ethanolamine ammonia-lyase small subunit